MSLPRFLLHPASIKQIEAGHRWITQDKYSDKFKDAGPFIIGLDRDKLSVGIFLNDPYHKKIKARFWKKGSHYTPQEFFQDLSNRIKQSINKRIKLKLNRENFYIAFAEADDLPGLEILHLQNNLIIRYYTEFWKNHIPFIQKILKLTYPEHRIWVHSRSKKSDTWPELIGDPHHKANFVLKEFGFKYQVFLGDRYDYGIYTDASSIRNNLKNIMQQSKKFLNLFSYTGAFSIFAQSKNTECEVTSVDLSEPYLKVFQRNIELNEQENHIIIQGQALKALENLSKEKNFFDLVLIDPPPSFSDGDKVSKTINVYPEYIRKMYKLMELDAHMVLLLNHRQTTREKFKKMIEQTISESGLRLSIVSELKLGEDCNALINFPESDYLKGYILKNDRS